MTVKAKNLPLGDEETDEEEPWHLWIKRVTRDIDMKAAKAHCEDWVLQQRRRKFRLAGHIARRDDQRWSTRLVGSNLPLGVRKQGTPHKRWEDDLTKLCGDWITLAKDREFWRVMEHIYVAGPEEDEKENF